MRPAAWVFVADLDELRLGPGDAHHLSRVLRLVPGEQVGASDGTGRWRPCVVTAVGGGDVRLEPDAPVAVDEPPDPPITVGFSLLKGDRPELVVQKLTELGVDRILPLTTARTVVRWDAARSLRGVTRLRQVAREAAMQARRSRLPEVAPVTSLAAAAAALGAFGALCEQDGDERPSLHRPGLLVGPEGGWDASETTCGLPTVALGPHTLRAETAAIAAGVLLCGLRSATVRSATVREASRGITPSE